MYANINMAINGSFFIYINDLELSFYKLYAINDSLITS